MVCFHYHEFDNQEDLKAATFFSLCLKLFMGKPITNKNNPRK